MRRDRGINGGYVSNWGSFAEEYMQRNCQYISLVSASYAFWCDDFEERGAESILMESFRECFRLKCREISSSVKITHSTNYDIPYVPFYDGLFIEDEKYLIGNYRLIYSDGTTAYLPVRFGTHIGCSNYKDPHMQNGFKQLSYSTLPVKKGSKYVFEAVYENPHPDKSLISVSYVPLDGKTDIGVELLGFAVEKDVGSDEPVYVNSEGCVGDIVGVQV
jgi:hypothetical protein